MIILNQSLQEGGLSVNDLDWIILELETGQVEKEELINFLKQKEDVEKVFDKTLFEMGQE